MKRKLFFLLCALLSLVGVQKVQAYTTTDLENDGWTKITSASITNVEEYYYVLVDAYSSNYVMSCEANKYRPCYKTIDDPVAHRSFVWILEGSGANFQFKSYATGAYFKQASGWNTTVGHGPGKSNVTGQFTLNSGKYDIKCIESNAMVGHWNNGTSGVSGDGEDIAANKLTAYADGFILYAISRATYDAAVLASRAADVAGATKAAPVDVTAWIQNADWSGDWGGWECTVTSSGNTQWGQQTLESWNANNVVVKQEFLAVPNGLYKASADLISGPGATHSAYVYAIGDARVNGGVVSVDASAGNYGTMSAEVAENTLTADNVTVTGNHITLGFDQADGWIVADNFHLYYYGPNLAASDALPAGDMEAGKWYYFDVAVAGSYNLTCSNLSDIVYSTDGSILLEDAGSISATFDASLADLEVGRYYVKSSSAQTLTVEASSFSYLVSDASANIAYIQPGNVVTVSYTVSTNDPSAELTQNYDGVTFDGTAINVIPGSTGFSFSVPADLEAGVEHTLYIPAGVIGYAAGDTYNAEQNISLTAVAIYDGVYYMYNTDTQNYISRSGNYATQAILDNWGLAFNVSTDANNNTELQYFDSKLWLGDDGFCYGDCSGGRVRSFNVTKVANGYKFLNTNNNKYLAVYKNQTVADAEEGVNLQGTSNIWYLESTTEHKDNYTKNENVQAASVASAAGLTGVTTKAGLAEVLAANYGESVVNVTGSKAEKFQQYAGDSKALSENVYYSETVSGLKAGIYKLSVGAFQRAASNGRVAAADGARSLIYLYAGANKTQIMSVMEYGAPSAYADDFEYEGKHYPNNEASAYVAIETGNYQNDVYVYLAEAGSLEIGIKNPTRLGGNFSTWAAYENWTLTYYEAKATPAEKQALAEAIEAAEAKTLGFENGEYAPYNNVDAVTALAAAKAINPETASGEAVVNATTALNDAVWTANTEEVNAIYWPVYTSESAKDAGNRIYALGWGKDGGSDAYNTRVVVGTSTSNVGIYNYLENQEALMTKFATNYGVESGYTMPLKANTIYKLSFKYGGMENTPNVTISFTDPEDNTITLAPNFRPTYANAHNSGDEDQFEDYTGYFVTNSAGNYVLNLTKDPTTQQQIAMGNIELKSANTLMFEEDDNLPAYAPGTYPNVTLGRIIKEGINTVVLPFSMTQADVENYFGAGSKVYIVDTYNQSKENITFATRDGISANQPCLLKATEQGISYEIANCTVEAASAAPEYVGTHVSMIGNYAPTFVVPEDANNYVISGGKFIFVDTDNVTMRGTRAYIKLADGNNARELVMILDDDPTAINSIEASEEAGALKDGKYFINGRIVIVNNGLVFGANGQLLK